MGKLLKLLSSSEITIKPRSMYWCHFLSALHCWETDYKCSRLQNTLDISYERWRCAGVTNKIIRN